MTVKSFSLTAVGFEYMLKLDGIRLAKSLAIDVVRPLSLAWKLTRVEKSIVIEFGNARITI
jgi:hypothetical protein